MQFQGLLTFSRLFAPICAFTLLTGCGGGDPRLEERNEDALVQSQQVYSGTTNAQGEASISFEIGAGTSAFNATILSSTNYKFTLQELRDPNGKILENTFTLSRKTGNDISVVPPLAVNHPYDPSIRQRIPSGTYTLKLSTNSKKGVLFTLAVTTKNDSIDYSRNATVFVNAILTGAVASDVKNSESVRVALGKAQGFYRDWGFNLAFKVIERKDLPSILPNPNDPSSNNFFEGVSAEYPSTINLLFAVDMQELNFRDNRFAEGGFTPLPAVPSGRSAIALSLRRLAGSDGMFDDRNKRDDYSNDSSGMQIYDDETLQMATVIAHEIGHALGLKNTVDLNGERVVDSDTLTDTESCIDLDNCQARDEIPENIMFPFSLRKQRLSRFREFWARTNITPQQSIIMKQNVLTTID